MKKTIATISIIALLAFIVYADFWEEGTEFAPANSNATYVLGFNLTADAITVDDTCWNITSTNAWNGSYCFIYTTPTTVNVNDTSTATIKNIFPANNTLDLDGVIRIAVNASDVWLHQAVLYGNFTGTYSENQTINVAHETVGNFTSFDFSSDPGVYEFAIKVNTTGGTDTYSSNYTVGSNRLSNIQENILSATSVTVSYDTAGYSQTVVYFGQDTTNMVKNEDAGLRNAHSLTYTGIPEGTTGYYYIEVSLGDLKTNSSLGTFTTGTQLGGTPSGGGGGTDVWTYEEEGENYTAVDTYDGSMEVELLDDYVCDSRKTRITAVIRNTLDEKVVMDDVTFKVGTKTYKMYHFLKTYYFIDVIEVPDDYEGTITVIASKGAGDTLFTIHKTIDAPYGTCETEWLGVKNLEIDALEKLTIFDEWEDLSNIKKINLQGAAVLLIGAGLLIYFRRKK